MLRTLMRLLSAAFRARPLPRTYWLVWVGALVNRLASMVVPFLALYLTQSRGFTVERAGLVVSIFGGGAVLAGPVGGVLADRIGRRATMSFSLGASALLMINLGYARTFAEVAVATALLGCVADLYRPAVNAIVADVVPPEDQPGAYGLLYWAANLGFAISTSVAGLLAQTSFFLLFVLDAATSVVFAAVVAIAVPETRPPRKVEGTQRRSWMEPYRDGLFLGFAFAQFLLVFCFFQSSSTLALAMRGDGLSPKQFGTLMALNGVLIVLLQAPASRVLSRFAKGPVLVVSALLIGTGFGLGAFAHTPALYACSIVVWTLGEILMSPLVPAIVAAHAPAQLRGTYQGVLQLAWGAASLLAPALGTMLLARFGARLVWSVCFASGVLAAALHAALAGPRERRLHALEMARSRAPLADRGSDLAS